MQSPKQLPIGMLILILSSGDTGGGTACVVHLGLLSQLTFVNLVDAPLSFSIFCSSLTVRFTPVDRFLIILFEEGCCFLLFEILYY